jgi:hypothetical protein
MFRTCKPEKRYGSKSREDSEIWIRGDKKQGKWSNCGRWVIGELSGHLKWQTAIGPYRIPQSRSVVAWDGTHYVHKAHINNQQAHSKPYTAWYWMYYYFLQRRRKRCSKHPVVTWECFSCFRSKLGGASAFSSPHYRNSRWEVRKLSCRTGIK